MHNNKHDDVNESYVVKVYIPDIYPKHFNHQNGHVDTGQPHDFPLAKIVALVELLILGGSYFGFPRAQLSVPASRSLHKNHFLCQRKGGKKMENKKRIVHRRENMTLQACRC